MLDLADKDFKVIIINTFKKINSRIKILKGIMTTMNEQIEIFQYGDRNYK